MTSGLEIRTGHDMPAELTRRQAALGTYKLSTSFRDHQCKRPESTKSVNVVHPKRKREGEEGTRVNAHTRSGVAVFTDDACR